MSQFATHTHGCTAGPAAPPAGGAPVTVVYPHRGWQAVDFAELWRYRGLLYFLVWRDIKVQYKQTVVGAAWVLLQPLVTTCVFSLVFGRFAGIPSDGAPYPVFVLAGLLPWLLFSRAVSQASLALVGQTHLITRTYFPRLLVPTASAAAGLVDFLLNLGVCFALLLWFGGGPTRTILLLPLVVLAALLLALGLGYTFAGLTLAYRDFKFLVPFGLQTWMYVSPVIYPVSLLPESCRGLMRLNPLTGIITGFRGALLGQPVDAGALLYAAAVAVAVFVFGLYYFRRLERRFADVA
jgi:lipopolysaccharide transport system permease protein